MPDIQYAQRPATREEQEQIANLLREHTEAAIGQQVIFEPFALFAHEGKKLVGSAVGKIYLGWVHIELFWVDEAHRGEGIGRTLMHRTEKFAVENGLKGIEVWTQSWQAPDFYRKLDYEEFAVLPDFTPGRKRHGFRRTIKAS